MALAYLVAIVGAILFTRMDGGVACLWVATAILGPYLAQVPVARWPIVMLLAGCASAVGTATIGLGPDAAGPLAVINMTESAMVGLLLKRSRRDGARTLGSFGQIISLIGGGAVVVASTGLAGAGVAAWATGGAYVTNLSHWVAAHFLGLISFAPVTLLLLRGDAWGWARQATRAERQEAALWCVAVAATALACFSQSTLPLLFLPLLPAMIATFRVGRIGGAVSIVLLAMVATVMTIRGEGPVAMIDGSAAFRIQFVQFYIATVVLTILPAAADLSRRKDVQRRLAMSEARYRLVMENATDVVLNVDRHGYIRFLSESAEILGGYRPDELVGTKVIDLVHPEDVHLIREAHGNALRWPGVTQLIEYRAVRDGLWLEARIRAIESEQGTIEIACAVRDISKRKAIEDELKLAALTDPLTGLGNRRAFNEAVDRVIDAMAQGREERGCIAVFDLDHFKRINDAHGHDAGDRVIQRFAEVALRIARGRCVVARLGGEEFGVLFPGADEATAQMTCDRLRRAFAAGAVEAEGGGEIRATVSVGVARIDDRHDRVSAMRTADAALYEAKRCGRNRLVLAAA